MLLDRYDLGIAVDTEAGLVVPVVRGCDRLSARGDRRRDRAPRRRRLRGHAPTRRVARLDLHGHERRQAGRHLRDAADQPSGGRDPGIAPHRATPRGPGRRGRRARDGERLRHLRPSGRRRRPGGRILRGRDPAPGTALPHSVH